MRAISITGGRRAARIPGGQVLALVAVFVAGAAHAEPLLTDDRFVLRVNAPPTALDVLANDRLTVGLSELRIEYASGVAHVDTRGTTDAGDDVIVFAPTPDVAYDGQVAYLACFDDGGCARALVDVFVRPAPDVRVDSPTGSGFLDVPLFDLPGMPRLQFSATPLVAPQRDTATVGVDPTPDDPWNGDGGTVSFVHGLPWTGEDIPFRLIADASGDGGDIDLYLGTTHFAAVVGRGQVACASATAAATERCEATMVQPGTSTSPPAYGSWWVLLHNRGDAPQQVRSEVFVVDRGAASEPGLVATGPGLAHRGDVIPVRVAWNERWATAGEARLGLVRVITAGNVAGEIPFRVDRTADDAPPTPIGREPMLVTVPAGGAHDRLFVDVPPGTTELAVMIDGGDRDVNLYVGRDRAPPPAPAIGVAPPPAEAVAASTGPGGVESVAIPDPEPGRWFARVDNLAASPGPVAVAATVTAQAPGVRPGSYFDPDRSGHGLFLYPAADQWTGLWYTYFQDGTPTWYYLQGATPGADGIRRAAIHRAAWHGADRDLVAVGEVVLTPIGADRFAFTWTLDGETGSEDFEALGRGCPVLGDAAADASSTWFDPAHDGTGYSTQFWPDYEYFAAFVYDARGVPRFVTAERPEFGGPDATLPLEQLYGFCPLCERVGAPLRRPIGTLRRTFDPMSSLDTIALAATFVDGVPGGWESVDVVQPLGGPGATQGCEP